MKRITTVSLLLMCQLLFSDQVSLSEFSNHNWELCVDQNWSEQESFSFFLIFKDEKIVVVSKYDINRELTWQKECYYSLNKDSFYIYPEIIEQPFLIIDYLKGKLSVKSPAVIHYDFIAINQLKEQFFDRSRKAMVNDSSVRIRTGPTLDSLQIGALIKNEIVTIHNITDEKMIISGMESEWYKIETDNGVVGWSYGYFLDFLN